MYLVRNVKIYPFLKPLLYRLPPVEAVASLSLCLCVSLTFGSLWFLETRGTEVEIILAGQLAGDWVSLDVNRVERQTGGVVTVRGLWWRHARLLWSPSRASTASGQRWQSDIVTDWSLDLRLGRSLTRYPACSSCPAHCSDFSPRLSCGLSWLGSARQ